MKKFLAILVAVALCLSLTAVAVFAAEEQTIYVKPSTEWLTDNPRFAAYFFGNGEEWVDCTPSDVDGIWQVTVPSKFAGKNVIFCRMNPSTTTNDWKNKWNQTDDLTVPAANSSANCYNVVGWDKGNGSWAALSSEPAPVEPIYYVAGTTDLCGVGWDPGYADNGMTDNNDGTHSITFTNVPAGDHQFKVTDGTWSNCWGDNGNNYCFTLTEISNVTITFNADTKVITVKTEATGAQPAAPEYYVAGTAGLCNSAWNEKDPANKMTLSDGLYTITYEDVPTGEHKFKVTNGTWSNCWGGTGDKADSDGNYVFTLTEVSDVTITFNADTKAITVKTEATGGESNVIYHVVGTFNDWTAAEGNAMTKGEDGKWTLEMDLAAGSYGYKICSSTNQWFPDGVDNEKKFNLVGDAVLLFTFDPTTEQYDFVVVSGNQSSEDEDTDDDTNDTTASTTEATEESKPADTTAPDITPDAPDTTPDDPDTVTVYAQVPAEWTEVGVYVWDANGFAVAWPGSAMTKTDDGWYVAEVPSWAANIIINNNGNGAQTQDIAIEMGRDLWIIVEATEGGFTGTVSYESAKTGDSTDLVALVAAMLFSAAGVVTLVAKKKEF